MPISKNSPPIFQHYNGKWRPLWRGRIHGIAALIAIPAGTLLILAAQSAIARVATSIYVASLFALYATSASYHLFTRTPHVQKIMQKLDHSMIFILIAGTYTPLCLLALPHSWGIPFLCFVWVAAFSGMVFKFGWGARRITGGMYIALGWAGVFIFPAATRDAGQTAMVLLGIGGVLYTIGAILFYLQRPRLVPHIFGYHEIWHVFTVLAGITQFIGIGFIVTQTN